MTPEAEDMLRHAAIVALLCWLVSVAFTCLVGLGDGVWRGADCQQPVRRIEYVVPGYRLGCWLGGVPE